MLRKKIEQYQIMKIKIEQGKKYRNKMKQLQKEQILNDISRPWSDVEIKEYNMLFNQMNASFFGVEELTEGQIKLEYLRRHESLFTKEELQEAINIIASAMYIPRTK